ncbi:MAG TPA: DUF2961 domain-containing protein [Armatimonadota bacterium]|nr:DUF2961 domain-containing protein [Armatimonadota bacterium]
MPTSLLLATPLMACSMAVTAPLTTGDLVAEMVDLDRLSRFPDPAYRTVQFSSHDRASVAPYAPGWYANSDGFGGEETPNFLEVIEPPNDDGIGRYLMAEVEGPGAIVRTWSAAIAGEVAVYLDHSDEPLYQGPAEAFLMRMYDEWARQVGLPEEGPPGGFQQAWSCYFPVPFAQAMRIEWTGRVRDIHFYHIEVRQYAAGTEVRTFSPSDLRTHQTAIERVRTMLRSPETQWPIQGRQAHIAVEVDPGSRAEALKLEGSQSIVKLTLKLEAARPDRALRQTILRAFFDGAPQPQVEAPLGDFFGSGPGVSPFDSALTTVTADGTMTCRLPMPFRRECTVDIENLGPEPVRVTGEAWVRDHEWANGRSLHLHAKWRVDHGLTAGGGHHAFDVPFLTARGRGVYVGTAVMLLNPCGVPTPGGNWWGEGDEKVWVDDDAFPSLFGTGSEDYFNYAWSDPALFDCAYCGQPLNSGPGNRGFVSNYRWHVLDALPFASRIDFYMELLHHSVTPGFTYGRLVYFYAEPGVRDAHRPITQADVSGGLELPEAWEPVAAGQARGAIFFQAEDAVAAGAANVEVIEGSLWSRGKALVWTPATEGETLRLTARVDEPGRYQLVLTTARQPNSGRVEVSLDGTTWGPVLDLHEPFHTKLWNDFLSTPDGPTMELEAGEHTITLTSRGKSADSGSTRIGLDFFWLLPHRR